MKRLTLTLFLTLMVFYTHGQGYELPKNVQEQIKRTRAKQNHITQFYIGKIKSIEYSSELRGEFLNAIIFEKQDGSYMKLWIPADQGANILPYLKIGESAEVKVTGDELLLRKIQFKDRNTQETESRLKIKISGIGNLNSILTSKGLYSVKEEAHENTTEQFNGYEIILDQKVMFTNREKNLNYWFLSNKDTLYGPRAGNLKTNLKSESISYIRPKRNQLSGYIYKSQNTYKISPGLYRTIGNETTPISTMGLTGLFLNKEKGSIKEILADLTGLVSKLEVATDEGNLYFQFDPKSAEKVYEFIQQKREYLYTLYFHTSSPDAHAKSEKRNYLYAIANGTDTLRISGKEDFLGTSTAYEAALSSYSGRITEIHYPKEVNKSSTDLYKKTVENSFRSFILNDSVVVMIRNVLALSLADYIEEGKRIEVTGWKRKLADGEMNLKKHTIILPKTITVDGKVFENQPYTDKL